MMTPDEITAFIANALGRNIQDEIEGIVVLNSDGSNPAEAFLYTIPVRVQEQPETLYARYDPLDDATALADGSPVLLKYNADGELEAKFDARRGRMAYGGVIPTRNMLFFQHTHQSDSTGGQLNAGLIFDAGQVVLERGGTEANLSATGAGHLIQATTGAAVSVIKDNFAAAVAPAVTDDSGDGYAIGSLWFDTTADNIYIAIDVSVGAAVWRQVDNTSGAGGWTDDGAVVRLTTSTDSVSIGTATANGKLYVLGDDGAEMTARIRAASGQSVSVFSVEDNSGNSLFDVTVNGSVTTNADGLPNGDFAVNGNGGGTLFMVSVASSQIQVEGSFIFNDAGANVDARFEGDNDLNLLFLDASTDRVGIGDATPDGRFAVVGRADEVQTIIRGNATQTSNILEIQDSASNVQVSVSGLGGAVFNEEGNDADFRIESNGQANAFFLDGTNGAVQQLGSAPAAYLHMAASTTSLATYRVPAGTAPSSPGAGDVWNDTTQQAMRVRMAGMTASKVLTLFTQTANAGPIGTTTETNLIGTGIGTNTLAANYLTVGKRIRVTLRGHYSTNAVARSITFRGKIGAVTFDDVSVTTDAPAAGRNWRAEFTFTPYTIGSGGTCWAHGWVELNDVTGILVTTATTAVNTTTTLALQLSAEWATAPAASTYFTCTECSIEALN